jgi:hypothetical protein
VGGDCPESHHGGVEGPDDDVDDAPTLNRFEWVGSAIECCDQKANPARETETAKGHEVELFRRQPNLSPEIDPVRRSEFGACRV